MKICSKCNIEKELTEFHKHGNNLRSQCKVCRCQNVRNYITINKDKISAKKKIQYYTNQKAILEKKKTKYNENPDKFKQSVKNYYNNNRDIKLDYAREYRTKSIDKNKDYMTLYRINNKETIKKSRYEWEKNEFETNPAYRIKKALRGRLRNALNRIKVCKTTSALSNLPKDDIDLCKILSDKWSIGMTWDNHGNGENQWSIDHYIPFAFFTDDEMRLKENQDIINHPLNLRPMWAIDNLKKLDKIPEDAIEFINKIKKELSISKYSVNHVNSSIGEAWQYKKRKEAAKIESDNGYWNNLDMNLKNTSVRSISISEAKPIVEQYEWLGTMSAINKYAFGIFFKDSITSKEVCGGVVVFGDEYAENLGVWDKYGFTNKIILLNRGVCLHWTPKNTGSMLISSAIKLLPKKYEIVTCTVDHTAGEIGTLYQACNFYYVGTMGRPDKLRFAVEIDGKIYGSRAMRIKVGSQKRDDILKKYPNAKFMKQKSKHRYFFFRGVNKKQHVLSIEHIILPYKKREPKGSL